jgi:hypothetical protein
VTPLAPDQWVLLLLMFLLGLFLGMYLFGGSKWKRRYREEKRLRDEDARRHRELEAQQKHAEAATIAASARDPAPPPR